jgi:hypothetical protein
LAFIYFLHLCAASSGLADTQLRFNPLGVTMVYGPWRQSEFDPWRISHSEFDPWRISHSEFDLPHWEIPARVAMVYGH